MHGHITFSNIFFYTNFVLKFMNTTTKINQPNRPSFSQVMILHVCDNWFLFIIYSAEYNRTGIRSYILILLFLQYTVCILLFYDYFTENYYFKMGTLFSVWHEFRGISFIAGNEITDNDMNLAVSFSSYINNTTQHYGDRF